MSKYRLVLIILFFAILALYFGESYPTFTTLQIIGGIGLFQFFFSVYLWVKMGNSLISPFFFFLLCLYLFSFGQSMLYPFRILSYRDLYYSESIDLLFKAQCYTLIFLNSFQIGALNANKGISKYVADCRDYNFPLLETIGWFLFVISFYPYMQGKLSTLQFAMTYGYDALYDRELSYGLDTANSFIGSYFIPSTICLYIANAKNRYARISIFALWTLLIAIMLMIGGRTRSVILMSMMLILYNYFVKPFKKQQLIGLVLGGMLVMSLLSFIANTRNEENKSFDIDINELLKTNSVTNTVAEMGTTMFCMIHTMDYVPEDEDYRYGKTYLYSFTTLIPNLGFWKEHPAKKEANMGDWLTNKMGLDYGTGFSMVAEAYINFGVFGFVVFYLFGFMFSSFFGIMDSAIKKKNIPIIVFTMIMFWMSLRIPRNSFIGLVRAFFFNGYLLYLIVKSKKVPIIQHHK